MYLQNKYTRIYFTIIDRAKTRKLSPEIYVERHHIIPKSLGGNNDKSNLVKLTAREHFICHLLLPKMTEGIFKQKMTFAAWALTMKKNSLNRKISNRTYQIIKENRATLLRGKPISEKHRLNLIRINTGKPCSEEKKEKIRKANLGKVQSEETKRKRALKRIGKKQTEKQKLAVSLALKGKTRSPLTIQKIKEARSKQIIKTVQVTCPYCGKTGGNRIMPRYHFNNCKTILNS